MHERARKMMQQQRDDEAKNSSCLLVLSLVCESESESESALSLGIWCCSCCHSSLILLPTISISNPTLFNLHLEISQYKRERERECVRLDPHQCVIVSSSSINLTSIANQIKGTRRSRTRSRSESSTSMPTRRHRSVIESSSSSRWLASSIEEHFDVDQVAM